MQIFLFNSLMRKAFWKFDFISMVKVMSLFEKTLPHCVEYLSSKNKFWLTLKLNNQ